MTLDVLCQIQYETNEGLVESLFSIEDRESARQIMHQLVDELMNKIDIHPQSGEIATDDGLPTTRVTFYLCDCE